MKTQCSTLSTNNSQQTVKLGNERFRAEWFKKHWVGFQRFKYWVVEV